jgi:hypothetical protein
LLLGDAPAGTESADPSSGFVGRVW